MRSYFFYPYLPSGAALMFEEAVHPDLDAAFDHAVEMLEQHASADRVEIWEGDVCSRTVQRPDIGERGASRPTPDPAAGAPA